MKPEKTDLFLIDVNLIIGQQFFFLELQYPFPQVCFLYFLLPSQRLYISVFVVIDAWVITSTKIVIQDQKKNEEKKKNTNLCGLEKIERIERVEKEKEEEKSNLVMLYEVIT